MKVNLCIKSASNATKMAGCARSTKGTCPEVLFFNF